MATHFDKSSSFIGVCVDVNEDLQHLLKAFPGSQIYCINCGGQVYGSWLIQWSEWPSVYNPARKPTIRKGAESDPYPKGFLDFVFIGTDEQDRVAECIRDYWMRVKIGGFISGVGNFGDASDVFDPTTVVTKEAFWWKVKDKWVVVSGCMRSGTLYMAHVLQKAGVKVNHEEYSAEGVVGWPLVPCEFPKETVLLHQVRHPLHSIGSQQTAGRASWMYISRFIPVSCEEALLLRCMKCWYYWNLLFEPKAVFRYRVEDLEDVWNEISTLVGISLDETPEVSKTTHTRADKYNPVTWADLRNCDSGLCANIVEMSEGYGYVF